MLFEHGSRVCWANLLPRILGALLLVAGSGCGDGNLLIVDLSNVPSGAQSLLVTVSVGGKHASESFDASAARIGLRLSEGTQGAATVSIDVIDRDGCAVARGASRTAVAGSGRSFAAVEFRPQVATLSQACSPSGWCWTNPLPQGNDLRAAWGASAKDIWTAGDAGTLLHWNGCAWGIVQVPIQSATSSAPNLRALWGSYADDAWAVGDGGTALHWNGLAWTQTPTGQPVDLLGTWGSDPEHFWATGKSGTILRWDGSAWGVESSGTTSALNAVWGSGSGDVWAVGEQGAIVHSDGVQWTASSSNTTKALSAVWGPGDSSIGDNVWTTGESGITLRWNAAQKQWQAAGSTSSQNLLALGGTSSSEVWAMGVSGECIHWTSQGSAPSWVKCNVANVGNVLGVWASSATDAWAVGQYGALLNWDGDSWRQKTTGYTTDEFAGIWGTGPSAAWAVGGTVNRTGSLFRWDGSHWQRGNNPTMNAPNMSVLTGIWGSGMNDIWLTGPGGNLLHGDGNNFQVIMSGTTSALYRVWGASATNSWAVGDAGVISAGKGTSPWTSTLPAPMKTLRDISGTTAQDVFAVGDAGTILHLEGTAWTAQASGTTADLGAVWAGGTSFAAGKGGTLLSKKGTAAWMPSTLPDFSCDFTVLWGTSPTDLWVAGSDGCIGHFDGSVWQVSNSGSKSALQGLWGSSSSDLWAVGSGGAILHYPGVR